MRNGDVIDFCVGWGPWRSELFLELIAEHCAARKLRHVVCDEGNVHQVIRASEAGRRRIVLYLDQQADYEDPADPYGRLGYAAKDGGAFVVNDPDRAKAAANKAVLHYHIERAGVPMPYTVVVRNWEPSDLKLTAEEKKRLGRPFVIKPARGYGKQGVAIVRGSVSEIARARRFDRGDDFLLQERIVPRWLGGRMGWFRVFYVLDQIIPCWWDTTTEHFAGVTRQEIEEHDLFELCRVMWAIGKATHMNFFSTELAVTGTNGRRRVVAIDYVNDPCDTTPQSFSHCGVPDRVVHHIAERLVETALRIKRGDSPFDGPSIWFAD